jgi:hypothetical protein
MIVLNERHLKRLLPEYVCYYHEDGTPLGLSKVERRIVFERVSHLRFGMGEAVCG